MGKFVDLKDQKIGEWEVLEYCGNRMWKCRCSCGAIKLVPGQDLRAGKSKSCGHDKNKFNDLTGKQFGEWTVLEYIGDRIWKCRCSCGTIKNVKYSNLVNGFSKSCGCKHKVNINDIIGKRFGNLTVLAFDSKDSYSIKYLCKCDCGNETIVYRSNLLSGGTKSCGCNFYINGAITRQVNGTTTNRTIDKILITSSREQMLSYIKSLENKPTVLQLCKELSLSESGILWLLDKYDIKSYVELNPLVSSYEDEIYNYLVNKYSLEIQRSNKKILNGKELDIYIPDKKLAIEFNGDYWHSDLFKNKKYHQNKFKLCASKHIRLISIFEYEWNNLDTRNKILKLIDSIIDNKSEIVYARNCEIQEVTSSEAIEFYDKFHIQNGINSKVNIALKYNDTIVGMMSFSKPRYNTKYQWEITRLCFHESFNIVGGTERMWKYFITKYNPNNIITYCDISKFLGNIYLKLGMTLDKVCEPSYIWIDSHENIVTRYQAQKHKLIEKGLASIEDTEDSAMRALGYMKIYNCGNLAFVWNKQ